METWFVILVSISIVILLKLIFFPPRKSGQNFPPGPFSYPIIGNLLLFRKSYDDFLPVFLNLHAKFGPIITLRFASRPAIFISDRFLTHQALVKEGTVYMDRPESFDGTNQRQISTAFYGNKWRFLRRNLTSEILQSSRLKSYSVARKWAVDRLLHTLKLQSGHPVQLLEHFQFSMFSSQVFMCFGEKIEDNYIREIKDVVYHLLATFSKASMIYMTCFWPWLTKFLFRKIWNETFQVGQRQKELFTPLIEKRLKLKEQKSQNNDSSILEEETNNHKYVSAYADTLLDLHLPEENRSLNIDEIVGLCSEFIIGGTHFTTSTLQWVMANLVKYPYIQQKLFMEIKAVVGDGENFVEEHNIPKIPYVKAVVLECLRLHPPGAFLLPKKVTKDVVLNGYKVPRHGTVNFVIGDFGKDPEVWEDPLAFKPERFMSHENGGEVFDITGSREIKMIPFGAGRRICPGYALALLQLEFVIVNLVLAFEWNTADEEEVDMEAVQKFALTMKNPLKANLIPRF